LLLQSNAHTLNDRMTQLVQYNNKKTCEFKDKSNEYKICIATGRE